MHARSTKCAYIYRYIFETNYKVVKIAAITRNLQDYNLKSGSLILKGQKKAPQGLKIETWSPFFSALKRSKGPLLGLNSCDSELWQPFSKTYMCVCFKYRVAINTK